MLKVKHERDCDCVVAGFRRHKKGDGSVGRCCWVFTTMADGCSMSGVCASFYRREACRTRGVSGSLPRERIGESSVARMGRRFAGRWRANGCRAGRAVESGEGPLVEPLRPELVVEVAYEHMQGSRFRHMSQFRRWRFDKKPADCTYAQLEVVPPQELMEIFALGR